MSRKWRDCFPALAPSMSLVICLITVKKFHSCICQVNSYERKRQSLFSHFSPKGKELKVSWHIWGHRGIVVAVPFLSLPSPSSDLQSDELWITLSGLQAWASSQKERSVIATHCLLHTKRKLCSLVLCHMFWGIQEEAIPISTRSFILFTLFSLIHDCGPDSVELQNMYECMHYNNLISRTSTCTAHYKMWQDN